MQTALEVRIVYPMVDAGLPAVPLPLEAGAARQRQAVPVCQSELTKILQPLWAQPWVIQLDRLPVDFLQFPARQHRADGRLPDRGHALPDEYSRLLLQLPFPEQVFQFLPALLIQPHSELLPAQGDGITGDKDKLTAIFLEYAGGAVLAPAVKRLQTEKGHSITSSKAFHQRLLLGGFHLIELGAK